MSIEKPDILLRFNKHWADSVSSDAPSFFDDLSKIQHPDYLWIGCSDSRVPETIIVNQNPGDLFVHRNIANLVLHSDINCQSVIQYAVEFLKVRHIIVCGHYGCGGILASLKNENMGLLDNWLNNIRELAHQYSHLLLETDTDLEKANLLAELNVQLQVHHVCDNQFVKKEWKTGRDLYIHGWMYNLETGMLKDLEVSVGRMNQPG